MHRFTLNLCVFIKFYYTYDSYHLRFTALFSSQTRLLAKTGKYVDAVVHTESPVRRNPENGVNESLKMVSHQSTSPYESLQLEGNTINDRHYQELQIHNRREANGPETSDYEPVRRY